MTYALRYHALRLPIYAFRLAYRTVRHATAFFRSRAASTSLDAELHRALNEVGR